MSARKAEAVEVEAVPIDAEMTVSGQLDRWLATVTERVEAEASLHRPPARIEDEAGYKACKAERAAVRRERAALDAERKANLKDAEEALRRVKAAVRDALDPLDALDVRYKALLDEWDQARADDRRRMLAAAYEEMAPALADMLAYPIFARAKDPEGRWLLRTVSDAKARELMEAAMHEVTEAYETLGSMGLDKSDELAARTELLRAGCDLGAAVRFARDLKEKREQVEAFEAERAPYEPSSVVPGGYVPEEVEPADTGAAQVRVAAPGEPTYAWAVSIPSATRSQMRAVADTLRVYGVHGTMSRLA